ncbi:hypothetical protein LB513_23180 [Mesorhizobium sp. ES1-1]|nr:hypothetical protein [Mesorhizobium sp. ES1-1]MBZ9678655.1 hypothetical protein [Mesorhizobium sp. ES1-1]
MVSYPAAAQTGKASEKAHAKPANLDRNGVLILTRGTLLALDQANKTGNYTVLRDLGSASFQNKSASDLAEIFAAQRRQMLDFSAVAALEPQLTLLPQTEPNGMLHMMGFFPSAPLQINFELLFEPVNRQWKVYGLAVNLTPGGPQAPDKPAAEPAKPVDAGPPEPPSTAVGKKKAALAKP